MENQQPFRAAPTELGGMGNAFAIDISRLTALPMRPPTGLAFQQSQIASSAEGATVTSKSATGRIGRGEPGAAPQGYENLKGSSPATAGRFTSGTPVGSAPIESRFQRLFAWRFEFLGRCPRLDFEIAPLA